MHDEISTQERDTLGRLLVWGETPTTDTAVERVERERERELARPRDDGAGA